MSEVVARLVRSAGAQAAVNLGKAYRLAYKKNKVSAAQPHL